jgi:predicted nucleotidyltransferase
VIAAAAKDPRFLAVLVAGSIASGTPDEYSDLDLVLVSSSSALASSISESRTG